MRIWFDSTAAGAPLSVTIFAGRALVEESPASSGCAPSDGDPVPSERIAAAAHERLAALAPKDFASLNLNFQMSGMCGSGDSGVTALWTLPDLSSVQALARYTWEGEALDLCMYCERGAAGCSAPCSP